MTRFVCSPYMLGTTPFFSGLTEVQLAEVLAHVQHRCYRARAGILRIGEEVDGLYVVWAGRVNVVHEDGDGRQFISAILDTGQIFGESGLIDGKPSSINLQAQSACEVLFLPRAKVLQYLEASPDATLSLLAAVVTRLRKSDAQMGRLALKTVYERVAHVLLESARPVDGELLVELGAEQIAAMVGASREMVSRVVGDMIKRHAVRRRRRRLVVLDAAMVSQKGFERDPKPFVASRPSVVQASL